MVEIQKETQNVSVSISIEGAPSGGPFLLIRSLRTEPLLATVLSLLASFLKNMNLHQLAEQHEAEIKQAVIRDRADIPCLCRGDDGTYIGTEDDPDMLTLQTRHEDAVWRSESFPLYLCCFVTSKKSGALYTVYAYIDEENERLTDFVCRLTA